MTSLGKTPCAIIAGSGESATGVCMAFVDGPSGLSRLIIPTAPHVRDPELFWSTLYTIGRELDATDIFLESFASSDPSLPSPGARTSLECRYEYRLDLNAEDLRSKMHGNHRRNLKKGQNHGLRISNISDLEALDIHCDLVMESLRRRKSKAEKVDVSVNRPMIEALLTSGCAEIWQATYDDHCHSSIVLLRSANAAYYHSAGTAEQGRKSGASVTLILSVAEQLRSEDVKIFNLGGAGAESAGLRRFKQGFGAKEICLGRAHIKLVSDPIRLFRRIRRRISRSG